MCIGAVCFVVPDVREGNEARKNTGNAPQGDEVEGTIQEFTRQVGGRLLLLNSCGLNLVPRLYHLPAPETKEPGNEVAVDYTAGNTKYSKIASSRRLNKWSQHEYACPTISAKPFRAQVQKVHSPN